MSPRIIYLKGVILMIKCYCNNDYNGKTLILTDKFLGTMDLNNVLSLIDIQRPKLIINNCNKKSKLLKQALRIQGYNILK